MPYETESEALDAEILSAVRSWSCGGAGLDDAQFDDLALRLCAYQLTYNAPYARYCARFGVTTEALPASWEQIPAVPAGAFKEAAISTFDPARAALRFETSGTTRGTGGLHYMETAALYDAALLAAFDRYVLADGARLRYLNLVPNPAQTPGSSLGYMMARVGQMRGDGETGWYLSGGELAFDAFHAAVRAATQTDTPVCIATTAFALVHAMEAARERGVRFALPRGSRIMETGGFKGRARVLDRDELYAQACATFSIAPCAVIAEYGMTELTSQYYDDLTAGAPAPADRRKVAAPWLRARVVAPDGTTQPFGRAGALVHVDLANRSSCIAIATEDVGVRFEDGLLLLGRERDAEPRGCSLDAETLEQRSGPP